MRLSEFYGRVRSVIFRTKDYFRNTRKERGIRQALKYLIIITAFFLLFTTYYYVANINEAISEATPVLNEIYESIGLEPVPEYMEIPFTIPVLLGVFLFLVVFFVLFAFVRYWATHLVVKMFNKDAEYQDTYKALSYSVTPSYLGGPFLLASFLLLPFLRSAWAWFLFIPSTTIFVSLEAYAVYLRSKALSIVQSISFLKALLSIYVFGFILFLLAVLVIYIAILIVLLTLMLLISLF